MRKIRVLLLPFGWIYGSIVGIRNLLYNVGILKSYLIPKKSICVGNLSVGGTGKTPLVDIIAAHFIESETTVSILSRGYGRSTKGFFEVTANSIASEVGDEPLFYKTKHKNKIHVFVAEKRKEGVLSIQKNIPQNELIILDDAYQHRAVKAGVNILVTPYDEPYFNDFPLPAGNLREFRFGKRRADILMISKCPVELNNAERERFVMKSGFDKNKVFFSTIKYDKIVPIHQEDNQLVKSVVLVTGIGNPTPLVHFLRKTYKVELIRFKDHHQYSLADIKAIHQKFDNFAGQDKIILTTEKDYMRIKKFDEVSNPSYRWYYQPITTVIDEKEKFNLLLDKYVSTV